MERPLFKNILKRNQPTVSPGELQRRREEKIHLAQELEESIESNTQQEEDFRHSC